VGCARELEATFGLRLPDPQRVWRRGPSPRF